MPLCAEFRPWKLVELALGQSFARDELPDMLARLQPRLRQLSAAEVARLAEQLQQCAGAVWCGAEAAADELASLTALAAGQGSADGDGQQAQQAEQAEQQQQEERQRAGACALPPAAPAAPQAAADVQQPRQGRKRERDVFHSTASRNAALLAKATQQAAARGGRAGAAAAAPDARATPGARLAGWLAGTLRALLGTLPSKLPGALRAGAMLLPLGAEGTGRGAGRPWHAWRASAPACPVVALLATAVVAFPRRARRQLLPGMPACDGPPAGSVVFTCRDAAALDCLSAEPRAVRRAAIRASP